MSNKKIKVCWLSAGVSSFIGGYLARDTVDEFIYIDIADQHPDSMRFIKDCEKALSKEVKVLKSSEYNSVEDCVLAFGGFCNRKTFFDRVLIGLKSELGNNGNMSIKIMTLPMFGEWTQTKRTVPKSLLTVCRSSHTNFSL